MSIQLNSTQLRFLRQRAQRLGPRDQRTRLSAAEVVRTVCAIQAQDAYAAPLSVWARSAGLTSADVERARSQERSLVRTWCLRGTLHLLAAADLGWLLPLLGPIFVASNRPRRLALGLDDETCARGLKLLRDALTGVGPLPRQAIVARLAEKGLPLQGQAVPHLLARAALEGLVCLGPELKNKATYVLLDEWLGPQAALPRHEALVRLARRYLQAYGPAAPADLGSWAGLPAGDVRAAWGAIAGEVEEVSFEGKPLWMLKSQADWMGEMPSVVEKAEVHLLPAFDTYLLGYKQRDFIIAGQDYRRINNGGGIIHPVVLVDGRAAAAWRTAQKRGRLEVGIEPFGEFPAAALPGLEAEAVEMGRFLGLAGEPKIEITA
jgi:hypothetical protein